MHTVVRAPVSPYAPARRPFGSLLVARFAAAGLEARRARAVFPVCMHAFDDLCPRRRRPARALGAVFARWSQPTPPPPPLPPPPRPSPARAHTSFDGRCASSDLVLVGALGGRRQGHAALCLTSSGGGGRLRRLHFHRNEGDDRTEGDADADQSSSDRHEYHGANCAGVGCRVWGGGSVGGARTSSARAHGGVGGGWWASGLALQWGVSLTRAADDVG